MTRKKRPGNSSAVPQNCTAGALTNVKIQGGTAAWLDAAQSVTVNPTSGWTVTSRSTGKNNKVWTITGSLLAQGTSVDVTVNVSGTVSNNCDETMFLSGAWSASGTAADGSKITTTYTPQASVMVVCSENCP
jgi:uncharacterized protein YcnI